jgi:heat-inducible transcriptional repressor
MLQRDESGIMVTIGGENKEEVFQDCSLITATYHVNGKQVGSVGVLGPTRLDYARSIAIVDYLTKSMTEILTGRAKKLGP